METHFSLQANTNPPCLVANYQEPAGSNHSCDSRYRSIFGQLDVMIESMRRHPGQDLRYELTQLLQSMRHHFGAENTSMGLVGYPDTMRHSFQHQSICVNAAVLCHRLAKSQCMLPAELTELRTLWLEHIKVHDRAFEDYLTS